MRAVPRFVLAGWVAALAMAGLSPAVALAGPSAAAVPAIAWGGCGAGLEAFQCARVPVPADYDHPDGARTTIAVTRLPASDPAHRIGTLFTNPGGPGGSGVDFVQGYATLAYSPQVRARYDVLGFDPRGVGASGPATCFPTAADEAASTLLTTVVYPVTAPQERQYLREGAELAVQCQTTSPSRFAHASTANVARDMDRLRQAAGDPKLTYYGYSYGTFLGATYAALFPSRVGRFVLDGTADPVAWSGTGTGTAAGSVPLGVRVGQGVGASQTFSQFTRRCRLAGPARCPLAASGDPAVTVPALFDRLLTEPVKLTLPDGSVVGIDQSIAVAQTFSALYYPAEWPSLAAFLMELRAAAPDQARLAGALAGISSTLGSRVRGEDYPSFGGAYASLCVDGIQSRRPFQYPQIADAQAAKAPYFGRYRAWIALPCEFWGLRDGDAYRGPWQQTTAAKVLVIGTRYDPATPYRQTRPYAARFPNHSMITVDGYGHTTLPPNVSTCAARAESAYLLTGVTPPDGTTCAQDVDPFPAGTAQRSQNAAPSYLPPPPAL